MLVSLTVTHHDTMHNSFCLQATEDEMRLLRFQRKLDDEKGAGLLGLSLQVHEGAGPLGQVGCVTVVSAKC